MTDIHHENTIYLDYIYLVHHCCKRSLEEDWLKLAGHLSFEKNCLIRSLQQNSPSLGIPFAPTSINSALNE